MLNMCVLIYYVHLDFLFFVFYFPFKELDGVELDHQIEVVFTVKSLNFI